MASSPNPPLPGERGTFDSLFLKPLPPWWFGKRPIRTSYLVRERLINGIIFE